MTKCTKTYLKCLDHDNESTRQYCFMCSQYAVDAKMHNIHKLFTCSINKMYNTMGMQYIITVDMLQQSRLLLFISKYVTSEQ